MDNPNALSPEASPATTARGQAALTGLLLSANAAATPVTGMWPLLLKRGSAVETAAESIIAAAGAVAARTVEVQRRSGTARNGSDARAVPPSPPRPAPLAARGRAPPTRFVLGRPR